jgi:hypothetical protein
MCGPWDWNTGKEGSDVTLRGLFPFEGGVAVVGFAPLDKKSGQPQGRDMPTRNVPPWGASQRKGEMGVVGLLHFDGQSN